MTIFGLTKQEVKMERSDDARTLYRRLNVCLPRAFIVLFVLGFTVAVGVTSSEMPDPADVVNELEQFLRSQRSSGSGDGN